MSWLDRLRQGGEASFRGVRFVVPSGEAEFGRRTVVHSYPGQDKPTVEDLGKANHTHTLEAYLIGQDYDLSRDRLRAEFEKPGPGQLVHPTWGELWVQLVGNVRLSETTEEGGMCRFSVNFVEVEKKGATPVKSVDTASKVDAAADAAQTAATEAFVDEFTLDDVAEHIREAAAAIVTTSADALGAVSDSIGAVLDVPEAVTEGIEALGTTAAQLVLLPSSLASQVVTVANGLYSAIGTLDYAAALLLDQVGQTTLAVDSGELSGTQRPELLRTTLTDLIEFGDDLDDVSGTTPLRLRQALNQAALIALMRRLCAVEACRAAGQIEYLSGDDARDIRSLVIDVLTDLAAEADDTTYAALLDLRIALSEHLNAVALRLPVLTEYTPAQTRPALLIAWELYGDISREQEIIARNKIEHPGFVPGGEALEVFSE